MAGGSHGLSGRAVPKRAVVGVSRGTEFVTGPFPEGSRVRETEKRCGAAVRRDAQVSGRELIERHPSFSRFQPFVRPKLTGCAVNCKSGDSKNNIDKMEGAAGIARNNQEKDYMKKRSTLFTRSLILKNVSIVYTVLQYSYFLNRKRDRKHVQRFRLLICSSFFLNLQTDAVTEA